MSKDVKSFSVYQLLGLLLCELLDYSPNYALNSFYRELVFISVSGSISAITSRGEVFILVGPVLEGVCGGLSTFNGVVHASVHSFARTILINTFFV